MLYLNSFFVGHASQQHPVKETVTEVSAVELVAELVQIALQVFGADVMENVKQRNELPVEEFVNISPEEAVEKLAEAFKDWDEPTLKVILNGYPLNHLKANSYHGCELTITGKTFKSGSYKGVSANDFK